jgi:acyl carrier protein phosphodiesterase
LHERYRHYDGVIIDIFYDYYLAKNWSKYSKTSLEIFSKSVYDLLIENHDILPMKSQYFTKHMIENNLLYNYQFEDRIGMVLKGMNHKTK